MSGRPYDDAVLAPPEPRARSPPDDSTGGDRKRRRKVLSCYTCRRRKLQCDRVSPTCGRCKSAGQSSSCIYSEDNTKPSVKSRQRDDSPTDVLQTVKHQRLRIQQLEAALARRSDSIPKDLSLRLEALDFPPTPISAHQHELNVKINDRETMLIRGKSFKTQFSGTTHPLGTIAHIPELNLFTKEALETYPVFQHVKQDIALLEARIKCADKDSSALADERLHTLLPPQADVDHAVREYFNSYERIYHIMHSPSFWQAYQEMWQIGVEKAPQHTLVLVLLMISAVSCLAPKQPWTYVANSSSAREKAIVTTQACEHWINRQSQKRVVAADFQIRVLLYLTKQTTASKVKRTWTEAGTLLRFCMSAGLHRNPELIKKPTTALEKELRCRIWAAVVDFELQASFDRGMISASWLFQSDTPGPSNRKDEDVSSEHPSSCQVGDFTDSWYLFAINESAALRSSLNSLLNNIRHSLTLEDVKQHTDDIEAHLKFIPECTKPDYEEAHSLARLKLLQYLLALHNRFLRSETTHSERTFSAMIILETSRRIVDIHQELHDHGKRAVQFLGYDLLRGALSIANVVSVQTTPHVVSLANIGFTYAPLVQKAIEMLTDKAARLGCEQRQLWVALAAHGFIKSRKDVNLRPLYMREAVDIITNVYQKMMECQEDGIPSVTGTGTVVRDDISSGIVDYLPAVPGEPAVSLNEAADPNLFNFDDFAAWTFEDWMFDPCDPAVDFDAT
jgi:hypothetical protein